MRKNSKPGSDGRAPDGSIVRLATPSKWIHRIKAFTKRTTREVDGIFRELAGPDSDPEDVHGLRSSPVKGFHKFD